MLAMPYFLLFETIGPLLERPDLSGDRLRLPVRDFEHRDLSAHVRS
ncbi:MAG: hypothetical protein MZW92_02535 [Comamonadaceae bacterium]|nr:hypothetical protein [Comamonadaceae bacterium]